MLGLAILSGILAVLFVGKISKRNNNQPKALKQ
jgi:hypothetical protein